MDMTSSMFGVSAARREMGSHQQRGFTLIELMIALLISLLILLGLVSLFVNMSRNTSELKKANEMIENGRFSLQALAGELEHTAFFGGYIPQYDNLVYDFVPVDAPTAVPNACAAFATWNSAYIANLIGVPLQSTDTLPAGAGCLGPLAQRGGTDVVVVRHLEQCVPGAADCDADVAGRLYMQSTRCQLELLAGQAVSATASTIELDLNAAAGHPATATNKYQGTMIRIIDGAAAGQFRWITAYDDATRVATVTPNWAITPAAGATYAFDYVFGTATFPLHNRTCVGTGTPAVQPIVSGPLSPKRRFLSNIYYVSDYAHPDRPGDVIPTLVRSSLDLAGGAIAHQAPVPLVNGVDRFRIELGIDDTSDSGAAVNYTAARTWANAAIYDSPTNRGDGSPDRYVRCTTAAPCTAADYANAVVAKIYIVIRSRDRTPEYIDNKTYCIGQLNLDGTCPAAAQYDPVDDDYQRHLFTTTVRLTNVSGRRETP